MTLPGQLGALVNFAGAVTLLSVIDTQAVQPWSLALPTGCQLSVSAALCAHASQMGLVSLAGAACLFMLSLIVLCGIHRPQSRAAAAARARMT